MATVREPSGGEVSRWGAKNMLTVLGQRSVADCAHFFLPHLQPGMCLLDCGCGPGSITVGLAEAVAPGEVVGVDVEPKSIAAAQQLAAEMNITNVRFQLADAYELPFPDRSFDAVFSHALLLHLREPVRALGEMRRVLKPGGLVGIRNDDMDGILQAPHDPLLFQAWQLAAEYMRDSGGHAYDAKNSRAWLNEAGFARTEASASYECFGTSTQTKALGDGMSWFLPRHQVRLEELGLTDAETIDRIVHAWEAWAMHPGAFFAKAWCEAIGWAE